MHSDRPGGNHSPVGRYEERRMCLRMLVNFEGYIASLSVRSVGLRRNRSPLRYRSRAVEQVDLGHLKTRPRRLEVLGFELAIADNVGRSTFCNAVSAGAGQMRLIFGSHKRFPGSPGNDCCRQYAKQLSTQAPASNSIRSCSSSECLRKSKVASTAPASPMAIHGHLLRCAKQERMATTYQH